MEFRAKMTQDSKAAEIGSSHVPQSDASRPWA